MFPSLPCPPFPDYRVSRLPESEIPSREHPESERPDADPLRPRVSRYYSVKWYVDLAVVILTAPIIVPMILFFMLLVRLTSRGPVIYTQVRTGKDGKTFKMYKIRSMVVDAESGKGATWTRTLKDPRITTLGRIMRKLHIDELPQIYNVLRGDMAVIGPRPERPEFVKKLKVEVPGYEYRTLVLPGMTGYAQLNWRADTGLEDVHRKLILDFEYMERVTFCFDMRILAGTAFQFMPSRIFGSAPLRLFGIYRRAEDSPWAEKIGLLQDHESVILTPLPDREPTVHPPDSI